MITVGSRVNVSEVEGSRLRGMGTVVVIYSDGVADVCMDGSNRPVAIMMYRLEEISDTLAAGFGRCKCGAITSNTILHTYICCDCKK
jgi:hypothetical protein